MITIIVPFYKVEKYADECIASVVNQTYKDIEIILVDDGSPDKCPQIIDDWAAKDSRIRVVHQENAGLSAARNAGLDIMRGEYVAFVDSDDVLKPDYAEELLKALVENNADIAVSRYAEIHEDGSFIRESRGIEQYRLDSEGELLYAFESKRVDGMLLKVVWNKLYRASLFKDMRFPTGRLHEDIYVLPQFYRRGLKVIYTDKVLYCYRHRKGSITRNYTIRNVECIAEAMSKILQIYYDDKLYNTLLMGFIHVYPYAKRLHAESDKVYYIELDGKQYELNKRNIQRGVRICFRKLSKNNRVSFGRKLKCFVAAINIDLYNLVSHGDTSVRLFLM